MNGFTLRHFSDIQPEWLSDFSKSLLNLNVDIQAITEEEIFAEDLNSPVFTISGAMETFRDSSGDAYRLFKYAVLGLLGDAFREREYGFFRNDQIFQPAMPLGFFLSTASGNQIKLYFRNTTPNPEEIEKGLDKLPLFLRSQIWDKMDMSTPINSTAFFQYNSWQFLN